MPNSFDALHEETRPLRLLDEPPPRVAPGAALASMLLIVLPLVAVLLL